MPDDIAERGYDASADMWVSDDRCCCFGLLAFFLSLRSRHQFMSYTVYVVCSHQQRSRDKGWMWGEAAHHWHHH